MGGMESEITIRPAGPNDTAAVRRLAALDSAPVPAQPWLVAETHGTLRAALSTSTGAAIADPFSLSGQLVVLLRTAAAGDLGHAVQPEQPGRRHPPRPVGRRFRRLPRPLLAPR